MAKAKKPKAAESKAKSEPSADRDKFMVRLPEEYRAPLQRIKEQTDRPFTATVRRALDAYFKANGITPPTLPGE